jgi:hypothetical protein
VVAASAGDASDVAVCVVVVYVGVSACGVYRCAAAGAFVVLRFEHLPVGVWFEVVVCS